MSSIAIALTHDHWLPMAAALFITVVGVVLGGRTTSARARYKIALPNLYANAAMFLNEVPCRETSFSLLTAEATRRVRWTRRG